MRNPVASLVSVLGLVCAFAFGFWTIAAREDYSLGQLTAAHRGSRDPAAIRKVYDFSTLDGSALSQATKHRIISGFEVIKDEQGLGIALGNFVVKGNQGSKEFSCRKFQTITLSFVSDGVAIAGEKAKMEIEGRCEVSSDINKLMPLILPLNKILGQPVADGEFDFWQEDQIKVRFSNVADSWPAQWTLSKVKMSNDNNEELVVEESDIQALLGKPAQLEIKQ
jgi:hypothetical protein